MKTTIGILCNDRKKLAECFFSSHENSIYTSVILAFDAKSAAEGLNKMLRTAEREGSDAIILIHQDVILFSNWQRYIEEQLEKLENWGVAGVWGTDGLNMFGHIWDTRLDRPVQNGVTLPVEVHTLDEVCLIIKTGLGFEFDEELVGWHLYGAYASLWMREKGYGVWVLDAPIVHKTNTSFDWEPDESFILNWEFLTTKFPLDKVNSTVCDRDYMEASYGHRNIEF